MPGLAFDMGELGSGQQHHSSDIESSMEDDRTNAAPRDGCLRPDACRAKGCGKLCQSCGLARTLADPAVRQRRLEAVLKSNQDADLNRRRSEKQRVNLYTMTDEERARRSEQGRRIGSKNFWACNTPEARAKAAAAIRRAHLAWCPEEYWPLNERMKCKKVPLDERKRIIAEEIRFKADAPLREVRRQIWQFDEQQRARAEREKAQAY